ncbi:hypothetical protein Ntsu_65060 [Nocardia sp. IFM 10818]
MPHTALTWPATVGTFRTSGSDCAAGRLLLGLAADDGGLGGWFVVPRVFADATTQVTRAAIRVSKV